jgi:hypothetical protein
MTKPLRQEIQEVLKALLDLGWTEEEIDEKLDALWRERFPEDFAKEHGEMK